MLLKFLAFIVLMGVVAVSVADEQHCIGVFTGDINCDQDEGKYIYQEGDQDACTQITAIMEGDKKMVPCFHQRKFDTDEDCKNTCFP